jgi:hypothetical protein
MKNNNFFATNNNFVEGRVFPIFPRPRICKRNDHGEIGTLIVIAIETEITIENETGIRTERKIARGVIEIETVIRIETKIARGVVLIESEIAIMIGLPLPHQSYPLPCQSHPLPHPLPHQSSHQSPWKQMQVKTKSILWV